MIKQMSLFVVWQFPKVLITLVRYITCMEWSNTHKYTTYWKSHKTVSNFVNLLEMLLCPIHLI